MIFGLLPLLFIVGEIYVFNLFIDHFGWINSIGLYLFPCFLGSMLLRYTQAVWTNFQLEVASGKALPMKLLSSASLFIAGLLLLVPSFSTRILALPLLIPGVRHLIIFFAKRKFVSMLSKGAAGFSAGNGAFQFRTYNFGNRGAGFEQRGQERDVSASADVIDVKPIQVTHSKLPTDRSESE